MPVHRFIYISIPLFLSVIAAQGQQTAISGKISDAETGEGIPFANVVFKGTSTGITTDFEGNYTLSTASPVDSVEFSYIGYQKKVKPVQQGKEQVININLIPETMNLEEVVVLAGENPAFEILRRLHKNRETNNSRNLNSYNYESYTKLELDVDNLSDKFKDFFPIRKITTAIDSLNQFYDEDGEQLIPVFFSETISRVYHKNNPRVKRENILRTRVKGVGVDDNSWLAQMTGATFQQYNFYQNWLDIVYKKFVSPIAESGRLYYEYELSDSLHVDGDYCYRLDVFPKSEQDLAFFGTVWITKKEYALKQIDATVQATANLNFVEKIKIQQTLEQTDAGAWLPAKSRVLLKVLPVKNTPGVLAKFYTSNTDFKTNQEQPSRFYDQALSLDENAYKQDEQFWEMKRHTPLTDTDMLVYANIDSIKNIPMVKSYMELLEFAIGGYQDVGPIDIGPYPLFYAFNNIEGHRMELAFRTNEKFSDKWIIRAYGAYGTRDEKFKYGLGVDYIISRSPWSVVSVDHRKDIDQVGLSADALLNNQNAIFYGFSRLGNLVRPYRFTSNRISIFSDLRWGLSQRITLKNKSFNPLFDFAYLTRPNDVASPVASTFSTTEFQFETRFSRDAAYLIKGNQRFSLDTERWPVITARYTLGVNNLLGGNFHYHRIDGSVKQNLIMGFLGTSRVDLRGGYIFNQLPYPLLQVHIGNESPFYTTAAFNTMSFFEFVSDQYVSMRYQHQFEGFILNRIPLMKKLKWRLVGSANAVWGGVREENNDIIAETDNEGKPIPGFGFFSSRPFVELGYGIENIFKVARIDAFHRLSYLNSPGVSKFTVKVSFQLLL